jgi:hypothetical protein
MKLSAFAAVLLLSLSTAGHAATTAQQELMRTCNAEAKGKKGDERSAFMKECLGDARKRQQSQMKVCNAENKGKKGDERKQAMSECLKKS